MSNFLHTKDLLNIRDILVQQALFETTSPDFLHLTASIDKEFFLFFSLQVVVLFFLANQKLNYYTLAAFKRFIGDKLMTNLVVINSIS